jgi:MFS family permease
MKPRRYFFLLLIPVLLAVLGGVVMVLWNAVVPDVFGWRRLTYGQAVGLLVLCRMLFGGFHFGPRRFGPPFGGPPHVREKWMRMSEEERARFKEAWRKRFGG